MVKRSYQTRSRKISRVKGYVLLSTVFFSAGLILGERIYTEYTIDSLVPVVLAAEHHEVEKPVSMQEWVLQTVREAGIDPYKVYMLIQCESKWNDLAINKNRDSSLDLGLFQLNEKWQASNSRACKLDYKCSTLEAVKIIKKQNFKPWTCSKIIGI